MDTVFAIFLMVGGICWLGCLLTFTVIRITPLKNRYGSILGITLRTMWIGFVFMLLGTVWAYTRGRNLRLSQKQVIKEVIREELP